MHSCQISLVRYANAGTGPPPFCRFATAAELSRTNVTRDFPMYLWMVGDRNACNKPVNSRCVEDRNLSSGVNNPNADMLSQCAPQPSALASQNKYKLDESLITD